MQISTRLGLWDGMSTACRWGGGGGGGGVAIGGLLIKFTRSRRNVTLEWNEIWTRSKYCSL